MVPSMSKRDLNSLWKQARQGDAEAAAGLLSALHASGPERQAVVGMVHPHTGRAHRVGLAGPVGVGKSSLLRELAQVWTARGQTVGLLTAEPAPEPTVALGDRLRLHQLSQEEGTLLHTLPADMDPRERIVAAGLVADALEALGCDPIFLEAPGLGSSEVELIRRSHTIVLVLVPDEALLQPVLSGPWLAGADLVVLNHADREEAAQAQERLTARLAELAGSGTPKPLIATDAKRGNGVEELSAALDAHAEQLRGSDGYERRRRSGVRAQLRMLTEQQLLEELWEDHGLAGELDAAAEVVARLDLDPMTAASELARRIRGKS